MDPLASLSASSKTKLPSLKPMLVDFQRDVIAALVAPAVANANVWKTTTTKGKKATAMKPSESPGAGLSPHGPQLYPGLIPDEAEQAEAAGSAAQALVGAYEAASAYLGHLHLVGTSDTRSLRQGMTSNAMNQL